MFNVRLLQAFNKWTTATSVVCVNNGKPAQVRVNIGAKHEVDDRVTSIGADMR